MQQEVIPRVSVEVGYHRRWFDSFSVTGQPRGRTVRLPGRYSVPVPADPRLPDSDGYVIGDLFDITPTAFGRTDNYITMTKNYGEVVNYWHGVDMQVNARLRNGLMLQGGTSTGRAVQDECDVVIDNPSRRNGAFNGATMATPTQCKVVLPFLTDVRGLVVYTVPKIDVQLSSTLQSRPGPEIPAVWNVPSAIVAQSLGRPLAGNQANVPVNVLNPGDVFGDRITQVDLRIAKLLRFGRTRTNMGIDVYNLLNSNVPLTYVTTYGTTWGNPNSILDARFVKLSAQIDF